MELGINDVEVEEFVQLHQLVIVYINPRLPLESSTSSPVSQSSSTTTQSNSNNKNQSIIILSILNYLKSNNMSTPTSTALAPLRLVVTGHDSAGKSIFTDDREVQPFHPFGPAGPGFSHFHSRLRVPVSNTTSPPDLSGKLPRCPPNGVWFGTSDFPPGRSAPMHRTLSLDYAVVLSGEIVCTLDGGEEKVIKAGEFVVQRGVNHEWHNRGSETCRIMFVMLGAEKIVLADGEVLEETVIPVKK